jgi:WD40 repeat protein
MLMALGLFLSARASWADGERCKEGPSREYPLAVSPDGKLIATGDLKFSNHYERRVRLISLTSREEVRRFELPEGENDALSDLAFSPDGKMLAWSGYGKIHLFAVATGKRLALLKSLSPTNRQLSRFDRTGTFIAAARADKHIDIWSIEKAVGATSGSPEPERHLGPHSGHVTLLAFHPETLQPASGLVSVSDNALYAWDAKSGSGMEVFRTKTQEPIRSLARAPDALGLLHLTVEGDRLQLRRLGLRLSPQDELEKIPMNVWPLDDVWHVDGKRDVIEVAFSPDGKQFVARDSTSLAVWDTATRKELGRLAAKVEKVKSEEAESSRPLYVHSFVFTPDSKKVVATVHDGAAYVWKVDETNFPLEAMIGNTTPVAKEAGPQ